MALILEGTDWNNAVSKERQANKLVYTTSHKGSILINMAGKNPEYRVGDEVTYMNGDVRFTGKVWYIYQGSSQYNLYIKHPNPVPLNGLKGGVVGPKGMAAPTPAAAPYESASTLLKKSVEVEPADAPSVDVVADAGVVEASMLPAGLDMKKLAIGAAVLVVGFVLYKKMGKKK